MADRERMNITLAFDENYVPYAYTTLLSIFENTTDAEIYLYVLERDLSDASKELVTGLCDKYGHHADYLYVDTSKIEGKVPTIGTWTIEVYFRLFVTELLPAEVDRLFYLDCDIIANKSLLELYKTDIDDYDFAACYDICQNDSSLEQFMKGRDQCFEKMFTERTYVNSGMILYNMKRMRENYSFSTYMDALKELNYRIYAPDQDLINYVHDKHIKRLDPRKYNYHGYVIFNELGDYEKAKKEVTIIHYIGIKPWKGGDHAHFDTELIWWEYAFRTPFAEDFMKRYITESLTDVTFATAVHQKNMLIKENKALREELKNAMDSVKNVIAMFSKQDN